MRATEHRAGRPFAVRVMTGASTGVSMTMLADAEAISWRAPYQSSAQLRKQINSGAVEFVDMHLSHVPQALLFGFFGEIDLAVVEATEMTPDGRVYLTTSMGLSPTLLHCAKRIMIEINRRHSPRLREMMISRSCRRHRIGCRSRSSIRSRKIGEPFVQVDPRQVIGIIEHSAPDGVSPFAARGSRRARRIADRVVDFLLQELRAGRIPAGVPAAPGWRGQCGERRHGRARRAHPEIPDFVMFTEVFQDSLVDTDGAGPAARRELHGADADRRR